MHEIYYKKEVIVLLNKNNKWLSWLLTVAMLLTLIPLNGLRNSVFAAQYDNPTLQAALDGLTIQPNATLVNVSGKDIVGGVSTSQIKTKFGSVKRVNLSNNFITVIEEDALSITRLVKDGNLLTPAERAITWPGANMERLHYDPKAINLADEFTTMTVAGKPGMTVKQLIDKGVIERLEVLYNGTLQAGVDLSNPSIPDATVKTWSGMGTLELKFYYKDLPNDPVSVSKTVTMHELKEVKLENIVSGEQLFKNIEKTIYVTKIGHNGEVVPVQAGDEANFTVSSSSGHYSEVAKTVENDKLKVTFKFTGEFNDDDLKVNYQPTTAGSPALEAKVEHLKCKAIKVVGIELIDEQSPNTAAAPKVTVVTPAAGGLHPNASQSVYIAKGTNCSAFENATYTQRETNLTTGKYYVKVKTDDHDWEYLTDKNYLEVTPGNGLGANLKVDGSGFVYLEVNADDNAPGATTIKVRPSNNVLPAVPIPEITLTPVLKQLEPEAYRIYQFEESDMNTFNSASDIDAALRLPNEFKYYEVKLSDTTQTGDTDFEIKEGSHKYYYPVGVYKKQNSNDKILKAVPFTQQKIWYQKEKNPSQPFGVDTPFDPATGYPGAPLTGTKITGSTLLSSGLKVKAVPKNLNSLTDVGTVALAMHHYNNNGIWFKIKWAEKEVKYLIPVPANHGLNVSNLNVNNMADKTALIDKVKELPGNGAYAGFDEVPNISVPIGTDYDIGVLAIYDNGVVEEVKRNIQKTAMTKGTDATSVTDDDIVIEQNLLGKWKITATKNGDKRPDSSGRWTDGKVGNYTTLKINNKTLIDFARVKLDYSNIKDVKLLAHDNIRLVLKPDGKGHEINSGKWHEGSTADMYQGNAGRNKKLWTTIYHIPVFTNEDLNTVDVAADTQDEVELKKVAFDEDVYGFASTTKIKVYDDSYQRQIHTSEELPKVNNVGESAPIQWEIKATMIDAGKMKPYKNHKFSDTTPATYNRTTTVTVKEPLYLTVGAIEEVMDAASPDNGKVTLHTGNDAINVDLGETKNLRIKLSNSMFTAFRTLDNFTDATLKYIKEGVYFYGDEAVVGDILKNKSSDFNIDTPAPISFKPDATGADAYRDLFSLYLASGQQNGIVPKDYELTHIATNSDVYAAKTAADRKTALTAELSKIKVKVFVVNGTTETLLSDAEAAARIDVKNTPNKPGMFDIKPHRRGHYRIRFVTEQDGVESPLFKHYDMTGNTVYGEGTGAEDWHIDVNVNKAKIKKIYYYIPENDNGINTGITVSENVGDQLVKIGSLSPSETQKEIFVYPVVEDVTLNHTLDNSSNFNTLGQIKTAAETKNKTLKDLLNEEGSGLSYMDDVSVKLQELVENDWKNKSDPAISHLITTAWTRTAGGHLALKVIVQKGEIKRTDNAKVKLDIRAGDFDAAATMLTANSMLKPADTPILMGEIQFEQEVQDWITDIRLTPVTGNVISKTETYQTSVEYVTAKGQTSHLTAEDLRDLRVANPASRQLKIEKVEGPDCEIIPVAGNPAKLSFRPSKVGKYKFVATTKNELDKPVPPVGETRTIEFEVKPTIKTPYDLYYGQMLQIEVDADDATNNLTYEPQTPNVLDTTALGNHKLKIDSQWTGLNADPTDPNNTVAVTVKVFDQAHHEIGEFIVNVHPRGTAQIYQLLPITSDPDPYQTKDGDRVELRLKKIFPDGTFEYTKIKTVTFKSGYDDGVTDQLTAGFAELDESSITDTSAFLTIKPVPAPHDNALKWHGEYEVTIDEDPTVKKELHLLKTDSPTHPNRNFEFYRLMPDGTVKKVADLSSPMPISKQQAATEKLFVVEDDGSGHLAVVNDYVLDVTPNDKIAYRMFDKGAGGAAKTPIAEIDDIKNNPDNYSRVEFNPIDGGEVKLTARDNSGTSSTEAKYQITAARPLSVSHGTAYTVTEGYTLTIVATVNGGDVATHQFQWQESTDGTTWNDVAGQTTATLNIENIPLSANGNQYRIKVTDQYQSITSTPATLTVNSAPSTPTGTIAPAILKRQEGHSGTFTVVLPSGVAPTSYQWKKQAEGTTGWTPISSATTHSYTIPSVTAAMDGDKYTCEVVAGGTLVTISNPGTLVVVDSSGNPINEKYPVTFKAGANGTLSGHGATYVMQVTKNKPITFAPTVVANSGYRFTGWAPSNPVGTIVTGPMTFTAQYSVAGGGGGGGGGGSTPTTPAPTTPTTPAPKPTPTTPAPTAPTTPVLQLNKNVKFAYLTGYPDGTVGANNPITRAEVSAIFAKIMLEEMVEGKTYPSQFKDVVSGKWFSNYIGFLEDYKVLTGYPDGTFKPNNKITRAEFAVIVSKFFETKTTDMNFKDVKANHWAKKYVDSLVANNMMGGYPDGTFKPEQPITRAEVVTVINKAINRTPDKGAIDANPENEKKYKDLKKNHWAYYDVIEASTDHTADAK